MAYVSREYDNTVNYLYGLQKHGIKLGLSNTIQLMAMLGRPHKSFHSIHVAGTNGKGSTATAISSILIENGLKVGLFTSPHLVSFTERIRINKRNITESEVIDLASEIRRSIGSSGLSPTFFEFVTAMAFHYFASEKIDWAVVETGMGGRLDATNVIDPEVAVITNISRDHCEFLGNTISDITYEKAGIIKPGVPVITASAVPAVIKQLTKTANSRGAGIHIYNKDYKGSLLSMDDRHITLDYSGYENYKDLTAPLSGNYQLYNLSTAIRACEILRQKGFQISDTSIKRGLQNIHIEGRLEQVSHEPPIILDSAHNPGAAEALAVSIKDLFCDKKIILVAGILDDKDIHGILNPLVQVSETVILTRSKHERAASPEKLNKIISDMHKSDTNPQPISVTSTDTVSQALGLAKSLCGEDHIIIVTGSFYTTGEVKEILGADSTLSRLREYK
ncbi:MAG: bifunctional folylpolyglutamate synthase/dihydrofolate synthase [Nitrospirae bacterium]|nr:bifunctional folylpolyglutamate synthase/dihydrofolate synthase [Nitrospirota bacterium]